MSAPHPSWLGFGKRPIDALACDTGFSIEQAAKTLEPNLIVEPK